MLKYKLENGAELRQVSMRYADELFAVVRKNHEYLGEWETWATKDFDLEKTKKFIERKLDNISKETEILLLIVFDEKIVGIISLFGIDLINRNTEIGYWIAEKISRKRNRHVGLSRIFETRF